ncbi:MAG: helix-turn-helix domain-containing protein, partial [Pseudomonadota bacterium]
MDAALLSPLEPFAPARATRIDGAAAARLLGQGLPSAEVASRLGCSRQPVWRILQRSKRVLGAAAAARERIAAEADAALLALLPGLVEALGREVQQGNARVLLWLAQRLGVGN